MAPKTKKLKKAGIYVVITWAIFLGPKILENVTLFSQKCDFMKKTTDNKKGSNGLGLC